MGRNATLSTYPEQRAAIEILDYCFKDGVINPDWFTGWKGLAAEWFLLIIFEVWGRGLKSWRKALWHFIQEQREKAPRFPTSLDQYLVQGKARLTRHQARDLFCFLMANWKGLGEPYPFFTPERAAWVAVTLFPDDPFRGWDAGTILSPNRHYEGWEFLKGYPIHAFIRGLNKEDFAKCFSTPELLKTAYPFKVEILEKQFDGLDPQGSLKYAEKRGSSNLDLSRIEIRSWGKILIEGRFLDPFLKHYGGWGPPTPLTRHFRGFYQLNTGFYFGEAAVWLISQDEWETSNFPELQKN